MFAGIDAISVAKRAGGLISDMWKSKSGIGSARLDDAIDSGSAPCDRRELGRRLQPHGCAESLHTWRIPDVLEEISEALVGHEQQALAVQVLPRPDRALHVHPVRKILGDATSEIHAAPSLPGQPSDLQQ